MKKQLTFLLSLIFSINTCVNAQGIYQYWGTTYFGGLDNQGVIYTTRSDGSGYTIQKQFPSTNPGAPSMWNRPVVMNGKIYCITREGGLGDRGTIGEYNFGNNTWTKKADLYNYGLSSGKGSMVAYNSMLYGVCLGGANSDGALFQFNPANNVLTVVHHFSAATGSDPGFGLTIYNSKLYGVTSSGGNSDDGVLFEFDPANMQYSKKADFNYAVTGRHSYGTQLVLYNNKLYGSTNLGGPGGDGMIYAYSLLNNTLQNIADLQSIGFSEHTGSLVLLNNKLYGSCEHGGLNFYGGIFHLDPVNNTLTKDYDYQYGDTYYALDLTVYNGKLYTSSKGGGIYQEGRLFSFNPANGVYAGHYDFSAATGSRPCGNLIVYNNMMYGLTTLGGSGIKGVLYQFNPNTNVYTNLVQFGGTNLRNPMGSLYYYNQKLYGMCTQGGANINVERPAGGIFEMDPFSGAFQEKAYMGDSNGYFGQPNGFRLFNNKLYSVARFGGTYGSGTLFEFDPLNGNVAVKHHFNYATGSNPDATPTVYNGKLYGGTYMGGANGDGILYEFNPANNTYTPKVTFSPGFGKGPRGNMVLYNNKLYGTTTHGGVNNEGVIYEYNPAINGYVKKYDFDSATGKFPWASMMLYNNSLWGTTSLGGNANGGVVYQYVPGATTISKKADFNNATGYGCIATMLAGNNKLYAVTGSGANNGDGAVVQFNPADNSLQKKSEYGIVTGNYIGTNGLIAAPAPTAPGSPNSCTNSQTINITAANANEWIPFTDAQGRSVAEINANGNILGSTTVRFYIHNGAIRQDATNDYYLDRNITITPTTQPATPVSIRLYIRHQELDAIIAQPGSNVSQASDLQIFRNADFCASDLTASKTQLTTLQGSWGVEYVYIASTDSLASFYLGGGANAPLPTHLLSFDGNKESQANRLIWKATCTHTTSFELQRSSDALNFENVYSVEADAAECNTPFQYLDTSPLPGKNYYRLHMKDEDGSIQYSPVICLDRSKAGDLICQVIPNPADANHINLLVQYNTNAQANLRIFDISGRQVYQQTLALQNGTQTVQIPSLPIPAGIYNLQIDNGIQQTHVKFMVK